MKFKDLLKEFNYSQKAYWAIYYLSSKIKNIDNYMQYKNEKIDFSPIEFQNIMKSSTPIERMIKKIYFYNQEYELLDEVFCPRNETELLIEIFIKKQIKESWRYIDICSGSGVIGISILKTHPKLKGTLLDISNKSIANIKINMKKHNIKAKVVLDDWENHLNQNDYEIISANFPYVGLKDNIEPSIVKNDPKIAIFSRNEGWEHYAKILKHLSLNKIWKLVILECNPNHANLWRKAKLEFQNFCFEFFNDFNNFMRIVVIQNSLNQSTNER